MALEIKIILASVRNNRFGDKPAEWITNLAKNTEGLSVELLDLKNYALPIFAEATPPSHIQGAYATAEINRWAKKIAGADGYIIVTPEYNYGYPASLKNNIDYLHKEWQNKPVAFVAYGSTGGARVVQQLREVSIELQMAPIRNSVHIMNPWLLRAEDGSLKSGALDNYIKSGEKMIEQLSWWAQTLKNARVSK